MPRAKTAREQAIEDGVMWFHSLPTSLKWELGDQFVLVGRPHWSDWFDDPVPDGFWTGASRAWVQWEQR